jgi:hypothetical protein
MQVRGSIRTHLAGVPITAPFSIRARRLGDCSQFPTGPIVEPR